MKTFLRTIVIALCLGSASMAVADDCCFSLCKVWGATVNTVETVVAAPFNMISSWTCCNSCHTCNTCDICHS